MTTWKRIARKVLKGLVPGAAVRFGRRLLPIPRVYPAYKLGAGRAPPPRSVSIEITYRCVCRCVMCALYGQHRSPWSPRPTDEELSSIQWQEVLVQLGRCGVQSVCFTGGEPLLREDLPEILGHAHRLGIRTQVLTSGALLDEGLAKRLVEAGLDELSVSLDGPREIHNAIRRGEFFDRAIAGIHAVQAARLQAKRENPEMGIASTIQAMNQHHLHELVPIAHELGLALHYGPLHYSAGTDSDGTDTRDVTGKHKDEHVLDCHRRIDVAAVERELGRVREEAKRVGHAVGLPFKSKADIARHFEDPDYHAVNKCFHPWYASRIDPFGNVYPCSAWGPCGNVLETPFAGIWNGAKYVEFRAALQAKKLLPHCAKCPILSSENALWNLLP